MDFSLDETQQAAAELADQILKSRVVPEEMRQREEAGGWFDADTHRELAEAGLVGIALGEDVGGGGQGVLELAQVLESMGRHVAPLPLWGCSLAALALDRFGSDEQRQRELPGVIAGTQLLTVGIQEWHNDNYLSPETTAARAGSGAGWQLTGTKIVVEFADEAQKILVTASTADGTGLFLADLSDSSISKNAGTSTNMQPVHEVIFTNTPAELVGTVGPAGSASTNASSNASPVVWLCRHAVAFLCVIQAGVVDKALKMTAEYTSTREQFGRPIATFQAVTQRLADQFMHVNGVKLSSTKALYLLSLANSAGGGGGDGGSAGGGGDDSGEELDAALHTAKWYASHCAHEIAHATQHVHGGMGVDRDYPLHRYTLWNKHIETSLGASTQQLRSLGALLAAG